MKAISTNRRGSALLIVLGILSFMVVSAVAFSVLMRQSRLPSSFLRQKVAAAQLTKAALANAMAEIDRAIGDNAYPGVGNSNGTDDFGNWWRNRVLMLEKSAAQATPDPDGGGEMAGAVSTMPMEGLAYVPPPLLTTVRYWMKRSPTAVWQGLGYDAGRYAYTAVNVSDYLDVNRLRANVMRDSSPSNRVSLAFLFENDQHTGDGAVSPQAFDEAMKKTTEDTYTTRLVSMADYALSVFNGDLAGSGFESPFCAYVDGGGGSGTMYTEVDNPSRQKFLVDSWFPGSLTNATTVALTTEEGQPFGSFDPSFDGSFDSLLKKGGSESFNRVMNHLNFPERVALKDYLDPDNVPTSLALPTLEHVPMLTGVRVTPVNGSFKPIVEEVLPMKEESVTDDNGTTVGKRIRRLWKLKGFDSPSILASATDVFPFKRSSLDKSEGSAGFRAQFLVKACMVLDGKQTEDVRLATGASVRPSDKSEWRKANLLGAAGAPFLTFYGETAVSVPSSRLEESDVVVNCEPVQMDANVPSNLDYPLYGISYPDQDAIDAGKAEKKVDYDTSRFGELSAKEDAVKYVSDLGVLGKAGGGDASANVSGSETTPALRWQFFVYVRIVDGDGNTVDMFPASFEDDLTYNAVNQGEMARNGNQTSLGEPWREAVVPVVGPKAMEIDKTTFFDETTWQTKPIDANNPIGFDEADAKTLAIYCDDPRYNWAPEDWFESADGNIAADAWLSQAKGGLTGSNCRPRDIFQFVSNRRYLQSMGEFQFLPLVRSSWDDHKSSDFAACSFCSTGRYDAKPFSSRSRANLANGNYMWKLYTFFPDNGSWTDDDYDPYGWGVVDTHNGAVVSQYADEDLFMAALANTPYDYIVSAMSEAGELTLNDGRPYCFSGFSSEANVSWDQLKEVAANLKAGIESGEDWWEMNEWTESGANSIFGASVSARIHDVDRKFLASYWRNCIGNEQQLFLVFVRAEPTVMGAASAGHTPAQLGGRAVALVWREPVSTVDCTPPAGEARPHRMRVLFYHQFE